jgi:hydrogenase nickel incorporation protein HypA/HybF
MHELALSQDIVRTALAAAEGYEGRIATVAVKVGSLSAVSPSSLEFCLALALEQRGLPQAEVRVRSVPAEVRCECGARYAAEDMFAPCPSCGSYLREVLSGQDVIVEYIEVEDEQDPAGEIGAGSQ